MSCNVVFVLALVTWGSVFRGAYPMHVFFCWGIPPFQKTYNSSPKRLPNCVQSLTGKLCQVSCKRLVTNILRDRKTQEIILPLQRVFGTVPCLISFSRQLPYFLMVRPLYASFLALTCLTVPCLLQLCSVRLLTRKRTYRR